MPITWDESAPEDGGLLSQGADVIRDLKAQIALGVSESMYWPGSGGGSAASAGVMKPGTFRAGYGVRSALSLGADTGRMYFESGSREGYLLQPSVDSLQVLSGYAIEHPQSCVSTARWVVSHGTASAGEAKSFGVTYNGIPRVTVSLVTTQETPTWPAAVKLDAVSATAFTASCFTVTEVGGWGSELALVLNWLSIGSVAF